MRAARAAGVRHYVMISALWADREVPPVIFRVKRETEEALIQSGLEYTVLRPAMFATGPSSLIGALGPTIERFGFAFVPAPADKPCTPITLEDVADSFVAAALDGKPRNRAYDLAGPERMTMREWAHTVADILGKRILIVPFPRLMIRLFRVFARPFSFGAYETMLFLEMLASNGFHGESSSLRELLGREPQRPSDAIREYYRTHHRTPWRDSNYGVLFTRSR